jgi:hypothetical protein
MLLILIGGYAQVKAIDSFEKIQIEDVKFEDGVFISQDSIIYKSGSKNLKDCFCGICTGISVDPKICFKCQRMFCSNCLEKHLKTNKYYYCPGCRYLPFMVSNLTQPMKNVLIGIDLRCPFGCGTEFKYENLKNHLMDCERFEHSFKCKYCELIIRAKPVDDNAFNDHIDVCPVRSRRCKHCDIEIIDENPQEHQKNCGKMHFNCKDCEVGYLKQFTTAHSDYYCPLITSILQAVSN